jgi:hypothetical protein
MNGSYAESYKRRRELLRGPIGAGAKEWSFHAGDGAALFQAAIG